MVPAEVFSLAEYLAEEMEARGWKTDDVAIGMKTSRGPVRDTLIVDVILAVSGQRPMTIDDETFAGLARAFGVSEEMFRNLDRAWREHPDRQSKFECPDALFSPMSKRAVMHIVGKGG